MKTTIASRGGVIDFSVVGGVVGLWPEVKDAVIALACSSSISVKLTLYYDETSIGLLHAKFPRAQKGAGATIMVKFMAAHPPPPLTFSLAF